MAPPKKKAPAKKPAAKKKAPAKRKAPAKKKAAPKVKRSPARVVALITASKGHELVIRSNPTMKEVEGFIADQHRRVAAGLSSGPIEPSHSILAAVEYETEKAHRNPDVDGVPLKVKGTLPKTKWPDWAKE